MNYKGYNIAVHELGHNVEQVFSLYEVDHTLLAGVPNTAFTEALAFVFQAQDLELLGLSQARRRDRAAARAQRLLDDLGDRRRRAGRHGGLALDVRAPQGDAGGAARGDGGRSRKDVWNRYYAPVLGGKDTPLLGIYSHMIAYPLYLSDYPLGHLIAFQIEEQMKKAGKLGPEFERMAKFGAVTPDLWMEHATGRPVGAAACWRRRRRR